MNSLYLSFLMFLVFRGIISSSQSDLFSTVTKGKEPVAEKRVQNINPDMVIQVGAFLHESNALSLKERLSYLLNNTIVIVSANGYFKVQITGFTNLEAIENLIPSLGLLGIKNIWVFRLKKKEDVISQVVAQTDTSLKKVKEIQNSLVATEDKQDLAEPTVNLQVGVFHRRSEALRAQRRITAKLNLQVEIVSQWEYYIVFITGFKTREEIFEYYPKLAALGYPDNIMIENTKWSLERKPE